jgi:hypothetical protein
MRKEWNQWSQKDVDYHERRNDLAKNVNLAEYLDHPMVFASRQSITGLLARTKLFEMILDVQAPSWNVESIKEGVLCCMPTSLPFLSRMLSTEKSMDSIHSRAFGPYPEMIQVD